MFSDLTLFFSSFSRPAADIFSSGDDSEDVAGRWYERYQTNNQAAVADLVNCILSAAGCDHHVTEDDINDPDNCSNRLTELQGIYEDVSAARDRG